MQKNIKLKTYDELGLYGTLDSVDSKELIIFVHGFTGGPNQHQYINTAKFLNDEGYDAFRFGFYPRKDDGRPMPESSITTHVKDLEVIVNYFKDKYSKITLAGHSLGVLVILKSDLSGISRLLLWDPSSGFKSVTKKKIVYVECLDKYLIKWGKEVLVSPEMIEEWKNTKIEDLVKNINVPCKVIFAGDRRKYDIWYPVIKDTDIEYTIIEDSTHDFVEAGKGRELFEETLKFIQKEN